MFSFRTGKIRVYRVRVRSEHTHAGSGECVRHALRALLRETAQPVAVITSLMPHQSPQSSSSGSTQPERPRFHGATLSSFSSIAMDPHPLVAFSLRIPSRMATALKNAHQGTVESEQRNEPRLDLPTHMVVNVLSAHQEDVAVQFSRADLHPRPFEHVRYSLTEEGLPILTGSLGALSCRLVAASWPLHDLQSLKHGHGQGRHRDVVWEGGGVASELFIAQVMRVEDVTADVEEKFGDARTRTPLLYYRRSYTTTRDTPQKHGAGPAC